MRTTGVGSSEVGCLLCFSNWHGLHFSRVHLPQLEAGTGPHGSGIGWEGMAAA